jgi:hypothetical protein
MAEVQYVSNTISVSPNPARYTANLTFNAETAGNATISVINPTGAAVSNKTVSVNAGINTRKLDVSSLVNGMYLIKIQKGSAIQMTKLVIGK